MKKTTTYFAYLIVAFLLASCASNPKFSAIKTKLTVKIAERTVDNDLGSFLVALEAQEQLDIEKACTNYLVLLKQPPNDIPFNNIIKQALPSLINCGKVAQAAEILQEKSADPLTASPFAALTIMSNALAQEKPLVIKNSLQVAYPAMLTNRMVAYWNYQALPPAEISPEDQTIITALKSPLYEVQRITRYSELITIYAEIFEQGLIFAHAGNYENAIKAWLPLYENVSDVLTTTQLALLITHAYSLAGLELEAQAFINQFSHEDPNIASAQQKLADGKPLANIFENPRDNLAEVLLFTAMVNRQHSTTEALVFASLAKHVHRSLESSRYALLRSYILSSANSPTYALRAIDNIKPSMPYYLHAMKLKASLLYETEKTDEAIALLDSLALSYPAREDLLLLKADFLRANKQYEKSIQVYNQLIDRVKDNPEPQHWKYYYHRAVALEQNRNWPAAERDMIAALDISPNQPSVLNYLGYSWVDRKIHLDRGIKMLKKALKLNRHDAAIIDSIGWAYYYIGDYKKAVRFLEEAIQQLPLDPTVNDHLGDAYWQVGRYREAYYQWRRALQMSPDAQHTTDLLHKSIHGLKQS